MNNSIYLKLFVLNLFFTLILPQHLSAQFAGEVDTTFGHPVRENFYMSQNNELRTVVVQPDHRVLIGGRTFDFYSGRHEDGMTRLNADDTYDSSGVNENIFYGGIGVNTIFLQHDGKIIAGGAWQDTVPGIYYAVARFNVDRSRDTTFNMGLFNLNGEVSAVACQPDGKILIGGSFTSYDGHPCNHFARLNVDGTYDTTFVIGTGFDDNVFAICFDSLTNRILVGGNFIQYHSTIYKSFCALDSSGNPDPLFQNPYSFNNIISKIFQQPNGKVIVLSGARMYRLNSNASIDTSFHGGTLSNVTDVANDNQGRMIVVGGFTSYNNITQKYICRLLSDGTFDSTFWSNANAYFDPIVHGIKGVALEANGEIICIGNFYEYDHNYRIAIMRFKPDGYIDHSFIPKYGFAKLYTDPTSTNGTIVQPDSKLIVYGSFDRFDALYSPLIIRLESDGSIDTSFHSYLSGANQPYVRSVLVDYAAHKIYVGGNIPQVFDTVPVGNIARLNWDGRLDTTFHTRIGANSFVKKILQQPDGKIILGGSFNTYNGASANTIVRLDSAGTIDPAFQNGTGFPIYSDITDMTLQPDGKIVAVGTFTGYDGHPLHNIVRINVDGTIDTTLQTGQGLDNSASDVELDANLNILVTGDFHIYNNNYSCNGLVRLHQNGSVDSTLQTGIGFNVNNPPNGLSRTNTLAIQQDGKILVGGGYGFYNGTPQNGIIRLNSNGSVDASFLTSIPSVTIEGITLQNTDRIYLAGYFNRYRDFEVNHFVRIYNDDISNGIGSIGTTDDFILYPNPARNQITIKMPFEINKNFRTEIFDIAGRKVKNVRSSASGNESIVINIDDLSQGLYFLRISTGEREMMKKFNVVTQ